MSRPAFPTAASALNPCRAEKPIVGIGPNAGRGPLLFVLPSFTKMKNIACPVILVCTALLIARFHHRVSTQFALEGARVIVNGPLYGLLQFMRGPSCFFPVPAKKDATTPQAFIHAGSQPFLRTPQTALWRHENRPQRLYPCRLCRCGVMKVAITANSGKTRPQTMPIYNPLACFRRGLESSSE